MFCHRRKGKTRNHPFTPCSVLNCTKALILWVKITLLFGAYFLALLETCIMLFLHTKSLSVQEPRGRTSSSKCQASGIFFSLCSCHATKYQERRYKSLIHWLFISLFFFALSSTWVKISILKITMLMKNGGQPQLSQLLPTLCPLLDSPLPKCSTSLVLVNLMRCLVFPAPGEIPGWHWVLTTSENTEKEERKQKPLFMPLWVYLTDSWGGAPQGLGQVWKRQARMVRKSLPHVVRLNTFQLISLDIWRQLWWM